MRLPGQRVQARLLERLNRFAVLVELEDGEPVIAHLANSGRLRELMAPGYRVYLTPRSEGRRRTRFDLALVDVGGLLVSADARLPSVLFLEAIDHGHVAPLRGYTSLRREVRWGDSRLDLLVERGEERWLVETKSTTLVEGGVALFPDAPTERGRRHVRTLAMAGAQGLRAAVAIVVQRADAKRFRPHDDVDPEFRRELRAAAAAGVDVWAYRCAVTPDEVTISEAIAVDLGT